MSTLFDLPFEEPEPEPNRSRRPDRIRPGEPGPTSQPGSDSELGRDPVAQHGARPRDRS